MNDWARDAIFYHIYPLGLCGAPQQNDFCSPPVPRLAQLADWIDHIRALGATAVYLGPVFESREHGYDTADYYRVDRRLGDNGTLTELVATLHAHGIRVILDGVFHHVGRDFWAFRDLQEHQAESAFRAWFSGVDFSRRSPYGDPFAYDGWNGYFNLVKLNLHHPEVRAHLFGAIQQWVEQFGIDGLRLDAADALDQTFMRDLATFCHTLRPDFWLLGEVIHGDYRQWANPTMLDSTTNYECYKGLFSSHNDHNYFEIAYALNRQFGSQGIYRELPLYAFADNHDVNRITSTLQNPAHVPLLYTLLFTMPGVPSIYYGSEWGAQGRKQADSDWSLRPSYTLDEAGQYTARSDLSRTITRLAQLRQQHSVLRTGGYQQLLVASEQFAFARATLNEQLVVVVNAANTPVRLDIPIALPNGRRFMDLLDPQFQVTVQQGKLALGALPAYRARMLMVQGGS